MLAHAGRRSRHLSSCVQQTPGHRRFYPRTGLQKDSKIDFNEVVELPTSKLTKQIGTLDLSEQRTAHRFMSAIQSSRYADAIAQIGRDFG